MSIAFRAISAFEVSSLADTTPAIPTGTTTGDIMLLFATYRGTGWTGSPTGWTLLGNKSVTVGSEAGDSGTANTYCWYREWQSGDAAPTVSLNGNNTHMSVIVSYSKTASAWTTPVHTDGGDTTINTAHSAAGAADPGGQAGDFLVGGAGVNGNFATSRSSLGFTWTGISGTATTRGFDTSSSGRDLALSVDDVSVSSGTSSAAPNITWTWNASTTNSPATSVMYVRLREDTGGATQDITGAGNIATAEAFGTATVSTTYDISAAGNIASAEAFGTAVVAGPVTATGIASAEAFGTPTVTQGGATQDITGAGAIATAEAFGTATVTPGEVTVSPTGIASAETFGTATVTPGEVTVSPSAIASAEAFGTATVSQPGSLSVSHVVNLSDTSNLSSYTTGSFTPTTDDLLVVFAHAQGSIATDTTLTASANGITFHKAGEVQGDLGNAIQVCFVAEQKVPASPASMTLTFDCTSDPATGLNLTVLAVTGMDKTGSTAVRQYAEDENNTAGTTPEIVFGAATLSTNPVLVAAGNNANPATLTEPTSFTEHSDIGHATPDKGLETASRIGHASATVTWGSSSATRSCANGVELDASASAPQTVSPSAIASAEAFGTATVTSLATISPTGIATAEAFGTVVVTPGPVTVSPTGIASAEAFGTPTVSYDQTVAVTGIASAEAFGTPTMGQQETQTVGVYSIISQETFGTPTVHFPQTITVEDILPPDPQFGQPTVSRQVFILVQHSDQVNRPPWYHTVDRVGYAVGKSVYKEGGVWKEGLHFSAADVDSFTYFYRGGKEHVIDDEAIRAELIAAGYTFITREIAP